jgi:hypothetical protein
MYLAPSFILLTYIVAKISAAPSQSLSSATDLEKRGCSDVSELLLVL